MDSYAQTANGPGMQGSRTTTAPASRKPLRLAVLLIGAIVILAAGLGIGATTSISAQKQLTTTRSELAPPAPSSTWRALTSMRGEVRAPSGRLLQATGDPVR
jgi:hypothetical protein